MTFFAVEASKTAKNVKVFLPGCVKNIGKILGISKLEKMSEPRMQLIIKSLTII